jgi:hypothetical protein
VAGLRPDIASYGVYKEQTVIPHSDNPVTGRYCYFAGSNAG